MHLHVSPLARTPLRADECTHSMGRLRGLGLLGQRDDKLGVSGFAVGMNPDCAGCKEKLGRVRSGSESSYHFPRIEGCLGESVVERLKCLNLDVSHAS